MAGARKQQIIERTRAAFANHTFTSPAPGSFSFMLSKKGYLGDQAGGPWLPHVMFFVPHSRVSAWGAGRPGSPVLGGGGSDIESAVLFVPVRAWSDGSPAPPVHVHHTM